MKIFSFFYDRVMRLSRHRYAIWFLGLLSFSEASFFIVPPDVMLAPMCLARARLAWRYAALTTIASVLGGVFGYLVGQLAFDLVEPILKDYGYWSAFGQAKTWFAEYGVWVIFLAGFSPIPYKIFTISAGVVAMPFLPFVVASVVGRGSRFFLVAGLMKWGGARMERLLHDYVDRVGWGIVALAVLWYLIEM